MDSTPSLIGLLPFWILVAGALWIGSSAWLDRDTRSRRDRSVDPDDRPDRFEPDRPWRGPT